jgi:hypothetical protein
MSLYYATVSKLKAIKLVKVRIMAFRDICESGLTPK